MPEKGRIKMDSYSSDYSLIQPFLHDGEMVLWSGKSSLTSSFCPTQIPILLFSLFWLAFAVFWTVTATISGGLFGLFGLPFVGVGIYLLFNSLFGQKKLMKNTTYVVTDSRAMILTWTRRGTNCAEYVFSNLSTVQLEGVRESRGTIRFATDYQYDPYQNRTYRNLNMAGTSAFLNIDNVQEVYRIISEQIANAR